jgi:hypothetical protein
MHLSTLRKFVGNNDSNSYGGEKTNQKYINGYFIVHFEYYVVGSHIQYESREDYESHCPGRVLTYDRVKVA